MNIKKRDDGHREKNIEKTITNVIVLELGSLWMAAIWLRLMQTVEPCSGDDNGSCTGQDENLRQWIWKEDGKRRRKKEEKEEEE